MALLAMQQHSVSCKHFLFEYGIDTGPLLSNCCHIITFFKFKGSKTDKQPACHRCLQPRQSRVCLGLQVPMLPA